MEEVASIYVYSSGAISDIDSLGNLMKERVQEVMDLAKEVGPLVVKVEGYDYNIQSASGDLTCGVCNANYQVSTSINLSVTPAENVMPYARLIKKQVKVTACLCP